MVVYLVVGAVGDEESVKRVLVAVLQFVTIIFAIQFGRQVGGVRSHSITLNDLRNRGHGPWMDGWMSRGNVK